MVGGKLPKALSKNPKAFTDNSTGLMNVPDSVAKLPTSGVDLSIGNNGRKGFKAGKKEGKRLTSIGSKRASRILRR